MHFNIIIILKSLAHSGPWSDPLPTPHHEKFGYLLICSGNPGQESQQRLGDSMYWSHVTSNWLGNISPKSVDKWN